MNESFHPSSIERPRKKWLVGWKWFWPPVILNGFYHTLQTFDFNYTANIERVFSIPYFVLAAMIGMRRGNHVMLSDFLFLVFGDIVIVTLLWHLNPHVGL